MHNKPGPGRPPLGAEARSETIRTRFTKAERDTIEAAARARGESLSDFVRGTLNRAAARWVRG